MNCNDQCHCCVVNKILRTRWKSYKLAQVLNCCTTRALYFTLPKSKRRTVGFADRYVVLMSWAIFYMLCVFVVYV